jgi:hypothetical protein
MFSMRPSIPVSQDASERLRLLYEVHALVRSILELYKDEMQTRLEPSTTPHFHQGVMCYNKPLLTRATKHEAKGPTTWTFYSGGTDLETQLHIETSIEITLIYYISCE